MPAISLAGTELPRGSSEKQSDGRSPSAVCCHPPLVQDVHFSAFFGGGGDRGDKIDLIAISNALGT